MNINRGLYLFVFGILAITGLAVYANPTQSQQMAGQKFEFTSYLQVNELFQQHDYTPDC